MAKYDFSQYGGGGRKGECVCVWVCLCAEVLANKSCFIEHNIDSFGDGEEKERALSIVCWLLLVYYNSLCSHSLVHMRICPRAYAHLHRAGARESIYFLITEQNLLKKNNKTSLEY